MRRWAGGLGFVRRGDLASAVAAALKDDCTLSIRQLANICDVSRATLGRRVRMAQDGVVREVRRGCPPFKVSAWAVDQLVGQLSTLNQFGIGFNHSEVLSMLRALVEEERGRSTDGRTRPISCNTLDAALKRNAHRIKFQKSRNLADNEVAKIDIKRVVQHYADLAGLVRRYPELASVAGRWVNLDESGLETRARDAPTENVAVVRGPDSRWVPAVRIVSGDYVYPHGCLLAATSADGRRLPSWLCSTSAVSLAQLVDYASKFSHPCSVFDGLEVVHTTSGAMLQSIFWDWFWRTLLSDARQRFPTGPLVFLMDNATQHRFRVGDFERLSHEPDVHVVFLPPNTAAFTQPNDVGPFGHFKSILRKIRQSVDLCKAMPNYGLTEDMLHTAIINTQLDDVWTVEERTFGLGLNDFYGFGLQVALAWSKVSEAAIRHGYRESGIVPLNSKRSKPKKNCLWSWPQRSSDSRRPAKGTGNCTIDGGRRCVRSIPTKPCAHGTSGKV